MTACAYCNGDVVGDSNYHGECQAEAHRRAAAGMCTACGRRRFTHGDWCAECTARYLRSSRSPWVNFPRIGGGSGGPVGRRAARLLRTLAG